MKTIELESDAHLAQLAKEAQDGMIVLNDDGKAIAAIVSLDGIDPEVAALSFNRQFLDMLKASDAQHSAGQSSSWDDVKQELGL